MLHQVKYPRRPDSKQWGGHRNLHTSSSRHAIQASFQQGRTQRRFETPGIERPRPSLFPRIHECIGKIEGNEFKHLLCLR